MGSMKHHFFIVLGLVLAGIFAWRAVDALNAPGLGLAELYVLGGFILSGALIWSGVKEWRAKRGASNPD